MALRFDRGTLRAPKYLADGSVVVEAVITRSGVFEYRNDDGTITREYRDPAEVFSAESMRSFELMAVADYHPAQGLITVENRSELGKGTILTGIRRDGNEMIAALHVTDRNLIAAMKAGRDACSCGYEQDLVKTPGTADGERYDAKQTNIRGNHVAIVDVARAGDTARVRMDAAATMIAGSPATEMKTMFKTLEEATAAFNAEKLRADSANAATVEATKKASTLEAERDAAKDAAAKAEKTRLDAAATAIAGARARVELEASAGRFLRNDGDKAPDFSKQSDREIRSAVIEKLTGKPVPATKAENDAYIDARYDAAIEAAGDGDAALAEVRGAVRVSGETRNDSPSDEAAKAHLEMCNRNQNAWKPTQKGS